MEEERAGALHHYTYNDWEAWLKMAGDKIEKEKEKEKEKMNQARMRQRNNWRLWMEQQQLQQLTAATRATATASDRRPHSR